jgi:hypothetical protein
MDQRPFTAAIADPITSYWETHRAFNEGRTDEGQYLAAVAMLDDWAPPTCKDFVRKFLAIYGEGGAPNAERSAMLIEQARRLVEGGCS